MPDKIAQILRFLYDNTDKIKGKWVIIGSTGLYLAGVKVVPHDIDILADLEASDSLNELLKPYRTYGPKQGKTELFESLLSRFHINGCIVEVMVDFKAKLGDTWADRSFLLKKIETAHYSGMHFPVAPILDQYEGYLKMGREKDQPKIIPIENRLKELGLA